MQKGFEHLMKLGKGVYGLAPLKATTPTLRHTLTHTHQMLCSYFIHLFKTSYVLGFVLDSGEPVWNKTGQSPALFFICSF